MAQERQDNNFKFAKFRMSLPTSIISLITSYIFDEHDFGPSYNTCSHCGISDVFFDEYVPTMVLRLGALTNGIACSTECAREHENINALILRCEE